MNYAVKKCATAIEIQWRNTRFWSVPVSITDPRIERIARRVKWWEPAQETLSEQDDFLCRVMTFGTWDDLEYVDGVYGQDAFRHALDHCRPGVMDPRSWNYWHVRLGTGAIPPMPQRTFGEPEHVPDVPRQSMAPWPEAPKQTRQPHLDDLLRERRRFNRARGL